MRTMKITTETKTSLSSLYSTATSVLTSTRSEAHKSSTTATGKVGVFGIGGR